MALELMAIADPAASQVMLVIIFMTLRFHRRHLLRDLTFKRNLDTPKTI